MQGCQKRLIESLEEMVLLLLKSTATTATLNQDRASVCRNRLRVRDCKRTSRRFALVSQLLTLLREKKHATLRELYYSNIQIYSNQQGANRTLAKLTQVLRVPRESLNVVSPSKAIVKGPILLTERTCKADADATYRLPMTSLADDVEEQVDCHNALEVRAQGPCRWLCWRAHRRHARRPVVTFCRLSVCVPLGVTLT